MSDLIGSFLPMRTSLKLKVRFVMVGIWNFCFSYLCYLFFLWIFNDFNYGYLYAITSVTIITTIISFLLHKYYTYKSQGKGIEMIYEFIRFCFTYFWTFLLSMIQISIMIEQIGLNDKLAGLVNLIIVSAVHYFAHLKFSFKSK